MSIAESVDAHPPEPSPPGVATSGSDPATPRPDLPGQGQREILEHEQAYLARTVHRRLGSLVDDPSTALFFGRIDRVDGERRYVGRRHVADAAGGGGMLGEVLGGVVGHGMTVPRSTDPDGGS
ncbi:MAG: hypothetical protein GXX79_02035 [Actinomycetales bacterium]|nr:hypothetical protein [Actinomycetales bacterium]